MKSIVYAIAATILIGALILAGCLTTHFPLGNKASNSNTEGQAVATNRTSASLMDSQEAQLRKRLNHSGVDVIRSGQTIHLNMPGHLTFSSGRTGVRPPPPHRPAAATSHPGHDRAVRASSPR